jgi:hypothetical protein
VLSNVERLQHGTVFWRCGVAGVMWSPSNDVGSQLRRVAFCIATSYRVYCVFSAPSYLDVGNSY